jgi:hypothetical protein
LLGRVSTVIAVALTLLAVIVGVPWFLRMPPWCDLTLYEIAATNIRTGGTHYRDVFDTNLPGFVWVLAGIQSLFGPSLFAVRAADLVIVSGVVGLLVRLARAGGADRPATAWLIAGIVLFYLFTGEFNHAQRDVWMMAPILLAVECRRLGYSAFWQGLFWGSAVWIKPHAGLMAATLWVACWDQFPNLRARLRDFLGNVLGGGLVGAVGVGYLVASGTWVHFVEVFTFWNAGYVDKIIAEFEGRMYTEFLYFPPWSYFQPLGWIVGIVMLWRSRTSTPTALPRRLLVVLYLVWSLQAIVVQRSFHYVHIPEIFLLLAVTAQARIWLGAIIAGWLAFTSFLIQTAWHPNDTPHPGHIAPDSPYVWCLQHPLADRERWQLWPACCRADLSERELYELHQQLSMNGDHFPATGNHWVELQELADELRRYSLKDGELLVWEDAPHAVYTMLGLRPAFRFLHVRTMMEIGPAQGLQIQREAEATHPKLIVADLERLIIVYNEDIPHVRECGPDLLPPLCPAARQDFPYMHKAIYRTRQNTGRYVIFRVK